MMYAHPASNPRPDAHARAPTPIPTARGRSRQGAQASIEALLLTLLIGLVLLAGRPSLLSRLIASIHHMQTQVFHLLALP